MTGSNSGDNYIIKYTSQADHYTLESATPNIKYIYNLSSKNFKINTQQYLKCKNIIQNNVYGSSGSSLTLAPVGPTWVVLNDNNVTYDNC